MRLTSSESAYSSPFPVAPQGLATLQACVWMGEEIYEKTKKIIISFMILLINKIKPWIGHHRKAWTSLSTTLCVTMSIKFIIMLPCHHVNQVDHHVTMTNKLILCHHVNQVDPLQLQSNIYIQPGV